ncbi:MAG: hypothetical protein U9O94_04055 [Nanoarchaeota archaeon]|nr:hypothetical protein [Nanoarchaeota archaeon]
MKKKKEGENIKDLRKQRKPFLKAAIIIGIFFTFLCYYLFFITFSPIVRVLWSITGGILITFWELFLFGYFSKKNKK